MLRTISVLATLWALIAPAAAQPEAPIAATLESIAEPQRPLVRARALRCFTMPDGTIWDGWAYFEQRKAIGYAVKPFDRIERGTGGPGQGFNRQAKPLRHPRPLRQIKGAKPLHDPGCAGGVRAVGLGDGADKDAFAGQQVGGDIMGGHDRKFPVLEDRDHLAQPGRGILRENRGLGHSLAR